MVAPLVAGGIITALIGLLSSKGFIVLIGIILAIYGVMGTSWMTGIPLWIIGLIILFIFIIISKKK